MNPSPITLRAVATPLVVAGVTTAVVFAAGLVSGRTLFRGRHPTAAPAAVAPAAAPVAAAHVAAPPATAAAAATTAAPPAAAPDSCGLPAGIAFDALSPADRSFALRRGFLCADRAAGRIGDDEYRTRLATLESQHPVAIDAIANDGDPKADDVVWAAKVRAYSSQYGEADWSAARALGAPDVPPEGGDDTNAWASEGADDRVEFLEVGFDRPHRVRGVDILETYNPGAVTRVELIATDGTRTVAYSGAARASETSTFRRQIAFGCSDQPIAAVRVTLDSRAIPDWNEIDAIGVRPCD